MEEDSKMRLKKLINHNRKNYMIKRSEVDKRLIFLKNITKPKMQLLNALLESGRFSAHMKYYFSSLKSRIKDLKLKLKLSKGVLKNAENIHNGFIEFGLSKNKDS